MRVWLSFAFAVVVWACERWLAWRQALTRNGFAAAAAAAATLPCICRYYTAYVQPRFERAVAEAWATTPMALCTIAFIVFWLSAEFCLVQITSFLWIRFQIAESSPFNAHIHRGL